MRAFFVFGFVFKALLFGIPAKSAIPEDVLTAYKAYNTALEKKDYDTALGHAKTAWKKAEAALGDSSTTGDLAYNYGFLAGRLGKFDDAIDPMTLSADLAHMAKKRWGPQAPRAGSGIGVCSYCC